MLMCASGGNVDDGNSSRTLRLQSRRCSTCLVLRPPTSNYAVGPSQQPGVDSTAPCALCSHGRLQSPFTRPFGRAPILVVHPWLLISVMISLALNCKAPRWRLPQTFASEVLLSWMSPFFALIACLPSELCNHLVASRCHQLTSHLSELWCAPVVKTPTHDPGMAVASSASGGRQSTTTEANTANARGLGTMAGSSSGLR